MHVFWNKPLLTRIHLLNFYNLLLWLVRDCVHLEMLFWFWLKVMGRVTNYKGFQLDFTFLLCCFKIHGASLHSIYSVTIRFSKHKKRLYLPLVYLYFAQVKFIFKYYLLNFEETDSHIYGLWQVVLALFLLYEQILIISIFGIKEFIRKLF